MFKLLPALFRMPILWCAVLSVIPTAVSAFNKCIVDGKTVYQEEPCSPVTISQSNQDRERKEALHQELDRLQAQGKGMIDRTSPEPKPATAENSESTQAGRYEPMSRSAFRAQQDQQFADIQEQTNRKNAASAERLTQILDDAKQACGDKLSDYPVVGMTDAYFRKCTKHARFGGIIQIVVSQDGSIPLRLYVFGSERAQKVYSIDGVITAIKP